MRKYALVAMSAISGACAFMWPVTCWWLIFFFMIPLFYYLLITPQLIFWREGLLWGSIFFGLQSQWIFWLMREKSQAPSLGLIAAALFIGFCSLNVALWFVGAGLLAKLYKKQWFIAAAFAATGIIFWWWIDRGMFWISGQCDGYPMVFPLVPLATVPRLLLMAPWFSMIGLLACLILFELFIAIALYFKSWRLGCTSSLFLAPFLIGFFIPADSPQLPPWAHNVGYAVAPVSQNGDIYQRAELIGQLLAHYHKEHPQAHLIVMPESTCPFALNENPFCSLKWDALLNHQDITLIVGGQESDCGNLYNTLFCICKGQIIDRHHKVHCFPMVERIPAPWSRLAILHSLFLAGYCQLTPGSHADQVIKLRDDCTFIPMICSELFFARKAPQVPPDIPILCLVNDSWFIPYMRNLLFLSARCKAILWCRAILYVGHYGAFWIAADGSVVPVLA